MQVNETQQKTTLEWKKTPISMLYLSTALPIRGLAEKNMPHTKVIAVVSKVAVSRMSQLEAPTKAVKIPLCTAHACMLTSQIDKSCSLNSSATVICLPGANRTCLKPLRTLGGSPASSGKPRYN